MAKRGDREVTSSIHHYRQIMPYLMRGRNESAVYYEFDLDVANAQALIKKLNKGSMIEYSIFHLFLRAATFAISRRPHLNRYVQGKRFFQREEISISFTAKKEFSDRAALVVIKMPFDPHEPFSATVNRIHERLKKGRSKEKSYTEKELRLALRFPRPMISFFLSVIRFCEYWNVLPHSFTANDPMYGTLFVANLGSIGLDAAWHHLYEYGNIPFFVTLGKIKEMVKVQNGKLSTFTGMKVRVTFDERVDDGFYVGQAIALVQEYFKNPQTLLDPIK